MTIGAALVGCASGTMPVDHGASLPSLTMPQPDPRATWRSIPLRDDGRIGTAYVASRPVRTQADARYAWIAINLANPIRLPEVEQDARSVIFLGEYRCGQHAWRPLDALWYRDLDGRGALLRDAPRGQGSLRAVAEDTLTDAFLDAICSG
jgi:hypothetical protein